MTSNRITLAITGASGAVYGLRLLECLVKANWTVYLLISQPARVVIATETDLELPGKSDDIASFLAARFGANQKQIQVFNREQWMSPIASGSNAPNAMVICPCSTGTLSAISNGSSRTLLERAADVMLKEGRKLILVPRETPYSAIHLENMLKLSRLGVTILPASPGFYHKPASVSDLVDFIVARILDHLHITHSLAKRWASDDVE